MMKLMELEQRCLLKQATFFAISVFIQPIEGHVQFAIMEDSVSHNSSNTPPQSQQRDRRSKQIKPQLTTQRNPASQKIKKKKKKKPLPKFSLKLLNQPHQDIKKMEIEPKLLQNAYNYAQKCLSSKSLQQGRATIALLLQRFSKRQIGIRQQLNLKPKNITFQSIQQAKTYWDILQNIEGTQNYKYWLYLLKKQANTLLVMKQANMEPLQEYQQLSCSEGQLVAQRGSFLKQLRQTVAVFDRGNNEHKKFSQIANEISFLSYVQEQNRRHNHSSISRIDQRSIKNEQGLLSYETRGDKEIEWQQIDTTYYEDEYLRRQVNKLILDTIKGQAMGEQEEWNYFKWEEHQQQQKLKEGDYKPITSHQEFKKFLARRKPKKNKASIYTLHSGCLACTSNLHTPLNPISSCPECHKRIHQVCLPSNGRCDLCNYKRLTKEAKQTIPECLICFQQGLINLKVLKNGYAHIFCLLMHSLWKVDDMHLTVSDDFESQHNKKSLDGYQNCKFCKQRSQYISKCSTCGSSFHYFCAFFQGCTFGRIDESIVVDCCSQTQVHQGRARARKFRINKKKMVFRLVLNEKKKDISLNSDS